VFPRCAAQYHEAAPTGPPHWEYGPCDLLHLLE
jgi:hypothetical protein